MNAEIISIGDELTSGQRLDTNSQWLSQQLGSIGVRVLYHTTVADELIANIEVFRRATQRADVVIATGGLGPTADDLTRQALAEMMDVPLVLDPHSLSHIEQIFKSRSRPMPESNRAQALFPAGSMPIPNPRGTAPGIHAVVQTSERGSQIFALPGVPAEMKPMYAASVEPALLAAMNPPCVLRHHQIKCFGAGESRVEELLPDLIRRGRKPTVGITVHGGTITLRITALAADIPAASAQIEPVARTIRECLGDLVFGEGEVELEQVVLAQLDQRQQTIATSEIGSRGELARLLGGVRESRAFVGGRVLASATPGDQEGQARELAAKIRAESGADWGLAIGVFPGDEEGHSTVPKYWIALSNGTETFATTSIIVNHPALRESHAAKTALNFLRLRGGAG